MSPKLLYVTLVSCLVIIIFAVLFLLSARADAFTDHRFVVNTDAQGGLFIDSFPDEMNNYPEDNYPHYLICLCREKHRWDADGILSGLQNCPVEKVLQSKTKIDALQKALDKVVPGYKIVCFSFILCYHDAVIYFEKNYTLEQMCVIAEKLNVERQNYHN